MPELRDVLSKTRDVSFTYYDFEFHVEYSIEKMTGEFRSDCLRLLRMGELMKAQRTSILERVVAVDDEDSERALRELDEQDAVVKRKIDQMLLDVIAGWDLLDGGKPVPLDLSHLEPLPAQLIGAFLGAVIGAFDTLGEATGSGNSTPLPITSSRKARRAISRQHRTG